MEGKDDLNTQPPSRKFLYTSASTFNARHQRQETLDIARLGSAGTRRDDRTRANERRALMLFTDSVFQFLLASK